ncbi:MAG: anti-sigma factor [Acidimicrobiales bacterium]
MTPPSLAPVPGEPPQHPTDDLAALLAGELDLARTRAVGAHLRRCPACRDELVEVAVATGTLRRVERTGLDEAEVVPPLTVVPDDEGGSTAGADAVAPVVALDDRRRARRRWPAVAAVVALVVLVGGAVGVARLRGPASGGEVQVALQPEGGSAGSGSVSMVDAGSSSVMTVTTRQLPPPPDGSFYEVWLFEPDSGQMLPVGVLPHDRQSASFTLPDELVGRYKAVDISVQPDDGRMVHSDESVLRGSYA